MRSELSLLVFDDCSDTCSYPFFDSHPSTSTGGGAGLFNGCSSQFNAPTSGWGAQYGGLSSRNDCAVLPSAIRAGELTKRDFNLLRYVAHFFSIADPSLSISRSLTLNVYQVATGDSTGLQTTQPSLRSRESNVQLPWPTSRSVFVMTTISTQFQQPSNRKSFNRF